MKLLRQPTPSTCGQTCVAMLAGIELHTAIDVVGHARGTRRREIRRVLERLGCRVGDLHTLAPDELPDPNARGLLEVRLPFGSDLRWRGHWAALDGCGFVFDPEASAPIPLESYREHARALLGVDDLPRLAFFAVGDATVRACDAMPGGVLRLVPDPP